MKQTGFKQHLFLLACLSALPAWVDGMVTEHNETDNDWSVSFDAAGLADLVIDDITFAPAPQVDELTTVTAALRNAGSAATGAAEPHGRELNTFLEDLNGSIDLLSARVGAENIDVIYGEGAPITDFEYDVGPPGTKDWRHGEVVSERHTALGDDLIPSESASLLTSGVLTFFLPQATKPSSMPHPNRRRERDTKRSCFIRGVSAVREPGPGLQRCVSRVVVAEPARPR